MGLGPPILALYTQLKQLGVLDGVTEVMELGAQNVWCPRAQIVKELFRAFSRPDPPADMLRRFADWQGSASELHLALGMNYACVDLDPSFDSIALDLNFDPAPAEHRGRYDLVTNHGTSEHIMNQLNVFQVMHDFTKPGGLMLHAVPFTVHLEHGFFNYQPNFFDALARYNGYKTLGMWVGPDWQLTSLVPWESGLLDYLVLNAKTTHLLVVLLRRLHEAAFCVPFQGHYETMIPDAAAVRYSLVVDGELYDGKRFKQLSKAGKIVDSSRRVDEIGGRDLMRELRRRIMRRIGLRA
jgi:SAM-dependent methyltransferase